jgi:uncharacterized protein
MARYYFDSSALVKHYHPEQGAELVDQIFAELTNRILISRLSLVELQSAFARLVREGILEKDIRDKIVRRVNNDVASGLLTVVAVSGVRLVEAAELLATTGLTLPLRSLDAIHLATAMALHKRTRLASFVAFDNQLLDAAIANQLPVLETQ